MRKNKIILIGLFIMSFAFVNATNVLNLEDCIAQAMKSNFDIQISRGNLTISENNMTLAPFLPTVTIESSRSGSETNKNSYNEAGNTVTGESTSNTLFNSAGIKWILFDGFAMFTTREKQKELLKRGQYNFKSIAENLVLSISVQYYKIISLHNQVNLLQELVSISQQRYNQALTRYRIGSDSGLEYKQAKIYLNSDSSTLLQQKENLKNAYIELNRLMNVPLNEAYSISDSIKPVTKLELSDLLNSAMQGNTGLLSLKAGENLAKLDLKLAKSERLPLLSASAGYGYNLSQNAYYPSRYDQSNGFNWGLSLQIPVFKGGEINRKIKNAGIIADNAELEYKKQVQAVESEVMQLYNNYLNNLRMIEFEEESREAAHLNLEAAMEKYRLGSLSGIEFRDYQLSYLNASDRKLDALYQTKVSEITLRLIAGELFKSKI